MTNQNVLHGSADSGRGLDAIETLTGVDEPIALRRQQVAVGRQPEAKNLLPRPRGFSLQSEHATPTPDATNLALHFAPEHQRLLDKGKLLRMRVRELAAILAVADRQRALFVVARRPRAEASFEPFEHHFDRLTARLLCRRVKNNDKRSVLSSRLT